MPDEIETDGDIAPITDHTIDIRELYDVADVNDGGEVEITFETTKLGAQALGGALERELAQVSDPVRILTLGRLYLDLREQIDDVATFNRDEDDGDRNMVH